MEGPSSFDDPLGVFSSCDWDEDKINRSCVEVAQRVAAEIAELAEISKLIKPDPDEGLPAWHSARTIKAAKAINTIQARVRGMIARQRVLAAKTKAQTSFYRSAVDVSAKSSVRHGVPATRLAGAHA